MACKQISPHGPRSLLPDPCLVPSPSPPQSSPCISLRPSPYPRHHPSLSCLASPRASQHPRPLVMHQSSDPTVLSRPARPWRSSLPSLTPRLCKSSAWLTCNRVAINLVQLLPLPPLPRFSFYHLNPSSRKYFVFFFARARTRSWWASLPSCSPPFTRRCNVGRPFRRWLDSVSLFYLTSLFGFVIKKLLTAALSVSDFLISSSSTCTSYYFILHLTGK